VRNKSIWDCHLTVHWSIKERTNSVLLNMAKDKGVAKAKIAQKLLESHPEYLKYEEEMNEKEFFL